MGIDPKLASLKTIQKLSQFCGIFDFCPVQVCVNTEFMYVIISLCLTQTVCLNIIYTIQTKSMLLQYTDYLFVILSYICLRTANSINKVA